MSRRIAFPDESRNGGTLMSARPERAAAGIGGLAAGSLGLNGTGLAAVRAAAAATGAFGVTGSGSARTRVAGAATALFGLGGTSSGTTVAAGANVITAVTGPAANSVAQRSTLTGGELGKGVGSMSFSVTLGGAAATLDYRVLQAEDDAVIKGWTQVATGLAAGTYPIVCPAVPARLGWLKVQFRSNAAAGVFTYANVVGCGRVIAMSGQSLVVRMFGKMDSQTTTPGDLGLTPGANGIVYATYVDSQRSAATAAWEFPANVGNYDSAGAVALLNDQVAWAGVTCALIGHSKGATTISQYVPGGAENATLRAALTVVGGFEQFIWFQGHSDSVGTTTQIAYQTALTSLFADLVANNAARGAAFERLICAIPNISSSSWGSAERIAGIRQAAADWAAANGAVYVQPVDITLIDGVHQSQAGAIGLARAFARAIRAQASPVIGSATRISALEVQLSVALAAGATALTSVGTPATRFKVFARGSTLAALALDGTTPITVAGSTITLKLAADPGAATALDVWFAPGLDPVADGAASMILDNSADGWSVGRPLRGCLRPVTAEAISPAAVGFDLTMTSPVYAASGAFGQKLTGGRGITALATDNIPVAQTWTIEARVVLAAAPGSTRVICGQGTKGWIGVHATGRLIANYTDTGGTDRYLGDTTPSVAGTNPLMADGIEHHVALVCTPQQRRLYLDGVLILATGSNAPKGGAGNSGYGVNTFGGDAVTYAWPGQSDEHAIWATERYIAAFTPPTLPHVGTEPGLVSLWHLDGNGLSVI